MVPRLARGPDLGAVLERTFSQRMYGVDVRKNTRLRVRGRGFTGLDRVCTLSQGSFACGLPQARGHVVLEFVGASTAAAAAYPEDVCTAWADALRVYALRFQRPTARPR